MRRWILPFAMALSACASPFAPPPTRDPFAGLDLAPPAETKGSPQRTYKSDVDEPDYRLKERKDLYAVIVGIEHYEGLPNADFAERDARAVRAHLFALGYPDRNVVLLTGRSAGRAAIEKYVESWLPEKVDERSKVLVYFSGHGAPDVKTRSAYLLPWDGDPKYLANTAYPLKRLYRRLDALKAKQVVVALDACFSGAGGRSVIPKGTRPLVLKTDGASIGIGRVAVLAASAGDEITGSEESQGHGLFTYHFLRGLNERRTSLKDLHEFLTPFVRDAARADNRDQTPQLLGRVKGVRLR
ncbi:MAG: caspase family protein [Elusimicrobiota bacterium]